MTKGEAARKFRNAINNAVADARWDGLTEQEIATILAGEAVR